MKSDHKHIYSHEVMLRYTWKRLGSRDMYVRAFVCTICGKIGDKNFLETEPCMGGERLLSQNEILTKYRHLPVFHVDNIFKDKFIKKAPMLAEGEGE